MQSSTELAHRERFVVLPCTLQPQQKRQRMTLWIPFNPGLLKISQSPSTLPKAIEPLSFSLQSCCKFLHHASYDFSKAGVLVMTGRQVVERARPIHSEMHGGRDSAGSFFVP